MLEFFRNNRFTTVFLLVGYALALHAVALAGWRVQTPAVSGPEQGVLYEPLLGWALADARWSALLALALILIQAVRINQLADVFRLLGDRSWLPGLFFVLLTAAWPEFLHLSPPLVAVTFLIPALHGIFKAYKVPNAALLAFDAGFWITVASLFYPPAIFLLLAAYAGLNTMRSFNLREQASLLFGMLVAVLLAWLWYFWIDRGQEFWLVQWSGLVGMFRLPSLNGFQAALKLLVLTALLVTVLAGYGVYFRKKLIYVQKCISVLYIFMLLTGFSLFLRPQLHAEFVLLLAPSLAVFLAMSFLTVRNRLIAELFHFLLLGTILFIQFYPQ